MKLSELKKLSGSVWFLIVGTMLSKASYFISMPYLALRMKSALNMDPMMIGLTLGIGPLVGILAGFYVGYLSDRVGRKAIFVSTILIWALTFFGFSLATKLWHFAILNMLNGLCNSANHPVSAALISDLTEKKLRKAAFHSRYFAINVGASFGPLVGAWLLLRDPSLGFRITAAIYLIYGIVCLISLPISSPKERGPSDKTATFTETLKALADDRPLLFYTLAAIVMGITYSQIDSTLPQYLQSERGAEGVKLFGLLIAINAITVVSFQIPLTRLMSKFSLLGIVKTGSFIYGLGFLLFGLLGYGRFNFIFSMAVLTLGEILIFSNGNLLIDQIAPEDKKGAYFGASGLWVIGAAAGPGLGGYVLMMLGGKIFFFLAGAVALMNVGIYRLGQRAQTRRRAAAGPNPSWVPQS